MGLFDIFRKKRFTGKRKMVDSNGVIPPEQMKLKAQSLLNQATASANLANQTSSPKIFFEAYNDTVQALLELQELEPYVPFAGRRPSTILAELQSQSQIDASVSAMVKRCLQQNRWTSKQQAEEELAPYWKRIPNAVRDEIAKLPDSRTSADSPTFNLEAYESANAQQIEAFKNAFDLTTAEGIRAITLQAVQPWIKSAPGVPSHPVEILSKQASAYQKDHLELAIECLRKANELRPDCGIVYSEDSYLRLVRYLCKAERFKEADREQQKIQAMFHGPTAPYSHEALSHAALERSFASARELDTDLVEISWINACCEVCGKYRGRIFSISGRDKRFPKFPADFCLDCGLSVFPIIEGVSVPMYSDPDHFVEEAQRPFIDTRTPDEIKAYAERQKRTQREEKRRTEYVERERKNHADYAWIRENLPGLAPKTLSGYRRMKTMNTENFQKLQSQALELGHKI
nr:hypothetical protein [uncultured Gemmiger sp.]